ncbi:uncharacterized protein YjaZ [Deinococcus metalli]|uniref:Uncharacterized protein YjaZ n=1 Tax=Deinococcus metalli TaxID=1141878 RepID=A0A7W8NQH0_9DEIO|nr:DUF2268 domain-containing putative Zn-dependent protease [Deinococcus metalli]MBB5377886.1 uncharacterized protein YjaZ [Deinococcus metalli]GHF55289.1 hypothetical protein GCM10017781_34490 [Deinococcus metalli]
MTTSPVNTLDALRAVLTAPEPQQDALYRQRVLEPLRPVWEGLLRSAPPTGDPAMTAARVMKLYRPEHGAARGLEAAAQVEAAGVVAACLAAVRHAGDTLRPAEHGVHLPPLHVAVTLAEPGGLGADGVTGAANVPGWVLLSLWPQRLPDGTWNHTKLPAIAAHEFHHAVRFAQPDWTVSMTLGAYLVAEGLAEVFAAELHGEASLGSWTTTLREADLRALAPRYGAVLDDRDFTTVRGYIFGDSVMREYGGHRDLGVPPYAGYALGYHVVRDFLRRSGRTVEQATYLPWREIAAGSGWFGA